MEHDNAKNLPALKVRSTIVRTKFPRHVSQVCWREEEAISLELYTAGLNKHLKKGIQLDPPPHPHGINNRTAHIVLCLAGKLSN